MPNVANSRLVISTCRCSKLFGKSNLFFTFSLFFIGWICCSSSFPMVIIQEIKRNIIFRRMQLAEPLRQEVPKIRMQAHLLLVTRKLISLLEYQGIVQNTAPISFFTALNATITLNIQSLLLLFLYSCFTPSYSSSSLKTHPHD